MGNFSSTSSNIPAFWSKIEFSLFLFGQLLSIPCYVFVVYHTLFDRQARKNLSSHVILLLLLYNFLSATIDVSLTMDFNRLGYVSLFHPISCLIWVYVDHGIWYGGISLMLWASFERHILVFHSRFVQTTRGCLLIHYIPLLFFALYAPVLYFYLVFLYPCNRTYNKLAVRCASFCAYWSMPSWFTLYTTFVNYTIPILLIFVLSGLLLVRFVRQKRRLQQAVTWRQCRKMIIQLTLVSAVYLLFDLPYAIIYIVQSSGYPNFASNIVSPYISRLTFVPSIVLPYAILCALPRLKQKLSSLLFWRRNRGAVVPFSIRG